MSGALVLWRDGRRRPAQSSSGGGAVEIHHRRGLVGLAAGPRQPTCATSALVSVTNIERSAANGRAAATAWSSFTSRAIRSSSTASTCRLAAAAAREGEAEGERRRIERDVLDVDEGPPRVLDRADQERRAVGAVAESCGGGSGRARQ